MKTKQPVIGIIGGTGKMGQWFTQFFQNQGLTVLIAGIKTPLSPKTLAKKADIVIVSVPISETQITIKEIVPFMRKDALLTDLTSFKVMPLEAMKEAKCATLGMHPLFGPSATQDQGLKIVFCKQKGTTYVDFLKNLFEKAGIKVIAYTGEEHDYQMAYIQAFTHAVNLLYAKIIFEHKNVLDNKLHTPIFTLQSMIMGRVLHQDIKLLGDIQLYNPYFLPVLEAFVEQTKKLKKIIEKEDEKEFRLMFAEEQKLAKNFSNFSTQQTNRILQQVNEVVITIPTKISVTGIPKNAKVAYLGPQGTFSNLAASLVFPKKSHEKIAFETFFDIFDAVSKGNIDLGIIPEENSTVGTIRETLDYLVDFSLSVLGSFDLPIHQQLLTHEKTFKNITVVISHPQALAQCKNWLRNNLPETKHISVTSTTVELQNQKPGCAYIASSLAAKKYHIPILAKDIEDNTTNTTKFYIIAKRKMDIVGIEDKKTLLFLAVYNRVGILRDILNVFAKHDINLTKLESRPSKKRTWDYHFFVEFEKTQSKTPLSQILAELETYCPIIRVLGKT